MLRQLYIRNFTLIDQLDMLFNPGFSVITGETGAGKSIILGAIGLLLGQRADMKTIKQGADKCVVEAHFDFADSTIGDILAENDIEADPADTIIRRELTATGKSRAFVNDTPVALSVLKELGDRLIDIHSQHQNLLLGKHDFQLGVVDSMADDQQQLTDYTQTFIQWHEAQSRLAEMKEQLEQSRQQADFMRFQHDELTAARLEDGEQEELEARSDTMTHAEDIKQGLYTASGLLSAEESGIVGRLRTAAQALHGIERVCSPVAELAARLDTAYVELKDVAAEVESQLDGIDFDPAELDAVNARLDRLYDLQKKYRVQTVAALIGIRDDLGHRLAAIDGGDELLAQQEQEVARLMDICRQKAQVLTTLRQTAARQIEQQLQQRLVLLGMPHVRFEVSIEPGEPTRTGFDRVAFLFSANTSTPLQPVSQVASGGEIARVMLAIKALSTVKSQWAPVNSQTLIFDEIDTGVSGKIAGQMAQIMAEMGREGHQVISITHLPQIAALGTTHYRVYKEETAHGTATHMVMLGADERVGEIAQMLSGNNVSQAAIENARQLLNQ